MKPFYAAMVAMAFGASVAAQDEPVWIELPPGVIPAAVSADGFTVVGSILGGGPGRFTDRAFYWQPTTGVVPLGGTQGSAVSADGRVIAGRALDASGNENAAIWQGGTDWRLLGSFTREAQSCDRLLSGTFGMNDDGRIIVGLGWDGCSIAHGFLWEESSGVIDLGSSVPGRSSRANDVSGAGQVIVGWQDAADGFRQGAVWRDGRQEIVIGPFGVVGEAKDTNSDGSIIVGQNCDPLAQAAWSLRPERGVECHAIEPPDPDPFFVTAMLATSEDGSVIGGSWARASFGEAVLWLDETPQFLKDYLRANGVPDAFENWFSTGFITDVSRDGRVIIGQGAGPTNFQGYIVILP